MFLIGMHLHSIDLDILKQILYSSHHNLQWQHMNTLKRNATKQQIMPSKISNEVNQYLSGTASNNEHHKLHSSSNGNFL